MAIQRLVPAESIRRELKVKNSRFIVSLQPVFHVEEAREFIRQIEAEYPDASHNVPVYIIGTGSSIVAHSSDDGEPSGTAGRPALAVLEGSGLGNVAVVVTRYFGGIKLGTGGLVRAYSDSVKLVVESVPRARIVEGELFLLEIPYTLLDQIQYAFNQQGITVQDREFGGQVILTVFVTEALRSWFLDEISNVSSGKIQPIFIEKKQYLQRI